MVIDLFYQPFRPQPGIHPTAVIDPSVKLGKNIYIGAYVVIEKDVSIGDDVCLNPNVVIYPGVTIGDRTILHSNCIAVLTIADSLGIHSRKKA